MTEVLIELRVPRLVFSHKFCISLKLHQTQPTQDSKLTQTAQTRNRLRIETDSELDTGSDSKLTQTLNWHRLETGSDSKPTQIRKPTTKTQNCHRPDLKPTQTRNQHRLGTDTDSKPTQTRNRHRLHTGSN